MVLEGFSPGDRRAIAAAMESELGRLMARADSPFAATSGAGARTFDQLAPLHISIAPGASPRAVGVAAARALGRGLATAAGGPRPVEARASGPKP